MIKLLQIFLPDAFSIPALKSPKNRRCSYLEVYKSVHLLNAVICDPMKALLWGVIRTIQKLFLSVR